MKSGWGSPLGKAAGGKDRREKGKEWGSKKQQDFRGFNFTDSIHEPALSPVAGEPQAGAGTPASACWGVQGPVGQMP